MNMYWPSTFAISYPISYPFFTSLRKKREQKHGKFIEFRGTTRPKYAHQFYIHINITSKRILKRISSELLFWMFVKIDCNRSHPSSLSSRFHLDSLKSNSDFLLCCRMICQERLGLWVIQRDIKGRCKTMEHRMMDASERPQNCILQIARFHIMRQNRIRSGSTDGISDNLMQLNT